MAAFCSISLLYFWLAMLPSLTTGDITLFICRNLALSSGQRLAHRTSGGRLMEVGDLIGSGTISGTESGTSDSLLAGGR
jgi:hypothetical protein